MMHLQLKQIFLTSWTEDLTDGAGMVVDLLVLKFSMAVTQISKKLPGLGEWVTELAQRYLSTELTCVRNTVSDGKIKENEWRWRSNIQIEMTPWPTKNILQSCSHWLIDWLASNKLELRGLRCGFKSVKKSSPSPRHKLKQKTRDIENEIFLSISIFSFAVKRRRGRNCDLLLTTTATALITMPVY